MSRQVIGKVTATEQKPTTCTSVQFWVEDTVIIRPFDVVRIKHVNGSHSFAIVKDLSFITDSAGHLANFVSNDFGDVESKPYNERLGTTIAEAEILSNSHGIEMPIRDGSPVEWAGEDDIRDALGLSGIKNPIPGGYMATSNNKKVSVDFDERYLVGPEAAHLNISGISGLASKTSYAMFLLNSIQQKMGDKVSIILFNVKGPDLLAIDRPNKSLREADQKEWEDLGLTPTPLKNVTYLYPHAASQSQKRNSSYVSESILASQVEKGQAFNYYYDVETFKGGESGEELSTGREKLSLLFSDIDDPNQTMESCIHGLGDVDADTWEQFRDEIRAKTEAGQQGKNKEISVQSWRKFSRLIRDRTKHEIFTEKKTIDAEKHRQVLIFDALRKLRKGGVLVVDIASLPDYLQCFVFGDVVKTVFDAKLGMYQQDEHGIDKEDLGKVVIFADELNKYAPATSGAKDKALTSWLLDVTERGRSLQVVLFGAEQFRSGVHGRILGNCGTNVFGRTNPIEVSRSPDYKHSFSQSNRAAATRLRQGEMILQHSIFNTALVKVSFPKPAHHELKG